MKLLPAALAATFLAITVDVVSVANGGGRTHRWELVTPGNADFCFIREHRRGFIVRTTRDTDMRFQRQSFGYERLEQLNAGLK